MGSVMDNIMGTTMMDHGGILTDHGGILTNHGGILTNHGRHRRSTRPRWHDPGGSSGKEKS
jgi:hypothetical protein